MFRAMMNNMSLGQLPVIAKPRVQTRLGIAQQVSALIYLPLPSARAAVHSASIRKHQ